MALDEAKIGEILRPGDMTRFAERDKKVRAKFWPALRKAFARIPFSRDLVAAYYCATDPMVPLRVRAILLAALAYFILPFDIIPDMLAGIGYTDDFAVLMAALTMVSGHLNDSHYKAADAALSGQEFTRDG